MIRNLAFWILCGSVFLLSCEKECPPPPGSNIDLTKGLLAYYPFNGNTNDESGNNNHGSIVGSGSLSYDEHGNANRAYKSNGNPDRIIVNSNGSIKFDTAFSVSFNVSTKGTGRINYISMVDVATAKGPSFAIGPDIPGNSNLNFGVPTQALTCDEFATESLSTNNTSTFTPEIDAWYNIICMYRKGLSSIYVNGKLISTKMAVDNLAHVCPNAELVIGGWSNADPTSLIGKMDEVRLYNRALNADEIAELAKHFQ